ncbi:hypothetical protein [Bradyrhizobium embrapense]|uniref:hypothetical protein n=1 Tax=Bradyrhizobium embrapense TaxID=630921 RepID=UPI000AE68556|nr:hypothetical protein [Bradyrhizobium embrapense]
MTRSVRRHYGPTLGNSSSLSAIHANRTVRVLRRSNLLQWHSRTITITDWNGLVRLAGFNPAYLRLPEHMTIDPTETIMAH